MKIFHLEIMSCNGQFHQDGREVEYFDGGTYSSREKAEEALKVLQTCRKCWGPPYYFPHCEAGIATIELDKQPKVLEQIW